MLQNIFENLIVTIIIAILSAFAKGVVKWFKESNSSPSQSPKYYHSAKVLKKQFYIFYLIFILSLVIALSVPAPVPHSIGGITKVFCIITALISGILTAGAFDAAVSFHPSNNSRNDKPANNESNNSKK